MKPTRLFVSILLILTVFCSCRTYKWERKRYYQENETKNWNNYNEEKTKQDQDERIKKEYYKK